MAKKNQKIIFSQFQFRQNKKKKIKSEGGQRTGTKRKDTALRFDFFYWLWQAECVRYELVTPPLGACILYLSCAPIISVLFYSCYSVVTNAVLLVLYTFLTVLSIIEQRSMIYVRHFVVNTSPVCVYFTLTETELNRLPPITSLDHYKILVLYSSYIWDSYPFWPSIWLISRIIGWYYFVGECKLLYHWLNTNLEIYWSSKL